HKAMIANISDAIVIIDEKGTVTYNSPNMMQRFPWMSKVIINNSFYDEIHSLDRSYVADIVQNLLIQNGIKKTIEARYQSVDGSVGYIELTAVNLTHDLNIKGILVNYNDITERKIREKEIIYLSQHDSLTGLYNRAFFEIEKLRLNSADYLPLSIIIGDINGLKIINDTMGHVEGDNLLINTGRILEKCCRNGDVVARMGGDEFNILLPNTSSEEAVEIINKINAQCKDYNNKMAGDLYQISISLGSATRTSINESMDHILKVAEDFMYNRKLLEGRSFHSSIISSMKMALFEKSHETEEHAHRLIQLSKAVGMAIGLTNQQFDELELFSTLHDIGKIGVDNQILNKPAKLTDDEWVKMRKHSEIGYRIAMASPELVPIAYYILTHHERWDGNGYPQGLIGENIPLLSRILAVADAYDAMTEDRPYRKGMSKQEAIREIERNTGTQFDPSIAQVFVNILAN
ncbi:MAG: HD domain-containing phosphohydrolase, partial [Mobilitalea sp.]